VEPSILTLTNLEVFLLGGFMKEDSLNKLISTKANMVMIKSKDLRNGLDVKFWNTDDAEVRNLSKSDRFRLLDVMRKDIALFLEKIIDWHLEGEQITSFTKGGSSLLPTNYQRFYDKCVAIETENYELYINDKAIDRCENIVYKLSERSKKDCFNFVKYKIESGEAKHLLISLTPYNERVGRHAWFESEQDKFISKFFPNNSVCYSSYPKEDGTYDEDDINNILGLIEEFTKARGLFEYGKSDSTDLVMYNRGSMKINCYNVDERIDEKVMSLLKKKER
jgi:hypothetical protein